jgi:hypothetical protein
VELEIAIAADNYTGIYLHVVIFEKFIKSMARTKNYSRFRDFLQSRLIAAKFWWVHADISHVGE